MGYKILEFLDCALNILYPKGLSGINNLPYLVSMKNVVLKIGVLILFFSLIGGFVLYKMGVFTKEKEDVYDFSHSCGGEYEYNALEDSMYEEHRIKMKEEGFEFPEDQYDEELQMNKDIIHSTKSLGGNSGIRIQDFIEEDSKVDTIPKLTKEQIMMFSSKSAIMIDPIILNEDSIKPRTIVDTTKKKLQIGSSKSIRLTE
ncbi:MAG: hypothetical protein ABF242_02470 [Flavobacteriales bacterium]